MKRIFLFFISCLMVSSAFAAPSGRGRVTMSESMRDASRGTAVKERMFGVDKVLIITETEQTSDEQPEQPEETEPEEDVYEKERNTCLSNNVGIGDTFVWASKYSNLDDYSSMTEDVEKPENNVCFVKVSLKSDDDKINTDDIADKYFQMGQNIVCGSWVAKDDMEKRILDAKKTGRVLGTVGAVVGGAGVGVGAMELFGNKLIGGKVEGQQSMQDADFWLLKLSELRIEDENKYAEVIQDLKEFKNVCNKVKYTTTQETTIHDSCAEFEKLFDLVQE